MKDNAPVAELRRLSQEWSRAFDAVDDLICLLAVDGTIARCNRKMAVFLGRQPDELAGRRCFELMHGSRVFFPDCPLLEMLKTGRRESFELPLGDKWYRVTADPIWSDGELIGAVHMVRDVTDLHETARRAEEKSSRMQVLNALAVDLAARPRGHDVGRFLAQRLRAITGAVAVAYSEYLPAEHLLATRVVDLRPGAVQKITSPLLRRLEGARSPVSDEALAEMLASSVGVRATLTEASFGDIPASVDKTVRTLLDVDRFFGVPYVVEGELYGTSVLALKTGTPDPPQDLLEAFSHLAAVSLRQQRAERDAILAAAQLDSFFELSIDILGTIDIDGMIRRVNPAWQAVLGSRPEEVEGRSALEFVHPDDVGTSRAQLGALHTGASIVDFVNRLRHKDGTYREIEWRITPYDDRLGFAVGRDVTGRAEAEEAIRAVNARLERRVAERTRELAAINRDLEEFVYSVAHDLRTPLRAVDGFSLTVLEDHWDTIGEDGRGDLQRVRAAAQTMGELIDALLSLTRISRSALNPERVDLTGMARRVADELRSAEPQRTVHVTVADGLAATTDGPLAEVVLRNLLGNAWKFTSTNEAAHIEVDRTDDGDGDEPTFFVRDDGVGFNPVYADKLFAPFQRLHTAEQFPGTGIGLATVARVLERLGGSWRADGEVGAGATFYFTLGAGAAEVAAPRD